MSEIIRRGSSENLPELPNKGSKSENLLDTALSHLPPEQREALVQKALEQKIAIDAEEKRAGLRFGTSSADMARDIEYVRNLEASTKSDLNIKSRYVGASGETNVEIKKNNNLVIIVIAVVIGIVVLFMLAKVK